MNLLQPQDKRSARPGDSREVTLARRRLYDSGAGRAIEGEIGAIVRARAMNDSPLLLDVGCGDGSHLGAMAAQFGGKGCGVDISSAAIDLAVRRFPDLIWIVANADRMIPVATASIDVVLSITARLNPRETSRILREEGVAIVAVPAPDDLRELRELVLGEAHAKDRTQRVVEEMSERFVLADRRRTVEKMELEGPALRDLLIASYRGQRRSQSGRLDGSEGMTVTSSLDVLLFARR